MDDLSNKIGRDGRFFQRAAIRTGQVAVTASPKCHGTTRAIVTNQKFCQKVTIEGPGLQGAMATEPLVPGVTTTAIPTTETLNPYPLMATEGAITMATIMVTGRVVVPHIPMAAMATEGTPIIVPLIATTGTITMATTAPLIATTGRITMATTTGRLPTGTERLPVDVDIQTGMGATPKVIVPPVVAATETETPAPMKITTIETETMTTMTSTTMQIETMATMAITTMETITMTTMGTMDIATMTTTKMDKMLGSQGVDITTTIK